MKQKLNLDAHQSVVSALKLLTYIKKNQIRLPPQAIMCFSQSTANRFRKNNLKEHKNRLKISYLTVDIYRYKKTLISIVSNIGYGGPVAVMGLEILRSLGVKKLFSLGNMASLSKKFLIGDKVFCKKAFRDEGCSRHYKADSLSVQSQKIPFNQDLLKLHTVNCWTTDAPFRETPKKILYFIKRKAQCVDMESASLLSAGEYYQMPVYCLGVISDHVSKVWTPKFLSPVVKNGLYKLLDQIYKLLMYRQSAV